MPSLRLVLVEPENAINVGMMARVMKNFGFKDLYIVRPMFSSFNAAYSAAMHARDVLYGARICSSIDEAVEGSDVIIGTTARVGGPSSIVRRAVELTEFLKEARWDADYAILMGRESTGLRTDELRMCDIVLTISTNPEYPTLNVVCAASIILYGFYMKFSSAEPLLQPVSRRTREIMLNYINEIVENLPLPEHKRRRALGLIRRVIGRALPCSLSEDEARYLMGVLRLVRDKVVRVA